jgi:hypothetical protein
VQAADFRADNLVFVVEPVTFAASASETGRQIAESVQTQIAMCLSDTLALRKPGELSYRF